MPEARLILRAVLKVLLIPRPLIALGVEQEHVNVGSVPSRIVMRIRPLPHNLIAEVLWPKNRVHDQLVVIAGHRVAMQIDRAGGLQDAMQFNQANGHHGQVGHALLEKLMQSLGQVLDLFVGGDHDLIESILCIISPLPRISKGFDLGL